ncbi:MAG: hypothetical protein AAF587_12475 [Bacteroidota bacterium]
MYIKHILLIVLLSLGLSQMMNAQIKPVAGDISLGFQITGLGTIAIQQWNHDAFDIPEVMGRYYISDRIALRTRLGVQLQNASAEFSDSYIDLVRFPEGQQIDTAAVSSTSGFGLSLTPGAEYHLTADASKLDPYVGVELMFGFKGATATELDQVLERRALDGTRLYKEDLNIKTQTDGGIAAGFNLLGGFNYFFSEKIAVGAEYSIGFGYKREGGDVRIATTGSLFPESNPTQVVSVDETVIFQSFTSSANLLSGSTVGVNLSIFW